MYNPLKIKNTYFILPEGHGFWAGEGEVLQIRNLTTGCRLFPTCWTFNRYIFCPFCLILERRCRWWEGGTCWTRRPNAPSWSIMAPEWSPQSWASHAPPGKHCPSAQKHDSKYPSLTRVISYCDFSVPRFISRGGKQATDLSTHLLQADVMLMAESISVPVEQ